MLCSLLISTGGCDRLTALPSLEDELSLGGRSWRGPPPGRPHQAKSQLAGNNLECIGVAATNSIGECGSFYDLLAASIRRYFEHESHSSTERGWGEMGSKLRCENAGQYIKMKFENLQRTSVRIIVLYGLNAYVTLAEAFENVDPIPATHP